MIRKGSVITVNNIPFLSVVYVIISFSWCCSLSTLLCQLQKEASIFETFIYWAQKYTVSIYLNENTFIVLISLIRKHITFNPILHVDDSATKAALASKWGKFVILEKCPLNLYKKRFQSNDEIRSTILLSHRRACYHWAIRPLTSAKVLQVII